MQQRYRKPPMFETFVEHLKEISSSNLTWEVRHDSLVCFEKTTPNQADSGKFNSVNKIIHELHMKLMPNEYKKEDVNGVMHHKFNRKALVDQLNARQWVVPRIKSRAEKSKESDEKTVKSKPGI